MENIFSFVSLGGALFITGAIVYAVYVLQERGEEKYKGLMYNQRENAEQVNINSAEFRSNG